MVKTKFNRDCSRIHHLHYGSGLPVFKGDIHQEGYGIGGFLSGLFRKALPVVAPMLKKGAEALARTAIKTGSNILSDVVTNRRGFKDSLKARLGETFESNPPSPKKRARPQTVSGSRNKPRVSKRKRKRVFHKDIFE